MTEKDRESLRKLEANLAELAKLANTFGEAGQSRSIAESVGDVLSRDYEDTDFAQILSDRDVTDRLARLLDENREQVERALERLVEGKYGICEDCEERIPTERLKFKPEATRCVHCQSRWDRMNLRSA
jgi:DnaK suppressor protein